MTMTKTKKDAAPAAATQQKATQRERTKSDLFTTRVTLHFSKTADRQMVDLLSSMGTRERSVFVQALVTKAQLLEFSIAAAPASSAGSTGAAASVRGRAAEPIDALSSAGPSLPTVPAAAEVPEEEPFALPEGALAEFLDPFGSD